MLPGNFQDNQARRRHIVNEQELVDALSAFSVKSLYLEDFSLEDKIKMFKTANLIIAPSSGALVFSAFSDPPTKIIEIRPAQTITPQNVYEKICNHVHVKHLLYTKVEKIDNQDNMKLDVPRFVKEFHDILIS